MKPVAISLVICALALIGCQTDKQPSSCGTQATDTGVVYSAAETLVNQECSGCHSVHERIIGSSFVSISKRNYTDSQLVKVIRLPKLINDSAEFEHLFKHLHDSDFVEIASWINSLKKPRY